MKRLFYTSNTMHYHKKDGKKVANAFDNHHHILEQLKAYLYKNDHLLFICSNPDSHQINDEYARLLYEGL